MLDWHHAEWQGSSTESALSEHNPVILELVALGLIGLGNSTGT
jgi:hypothetical protein